MVAIWLEVVIRLFFSAMLKCGWAILGILIYFKLDTLYTVLMTK